MKLSAVIVSRNDGYGGNLHGRAISCLRAMIQSFDEVIFVDWASPGITLIEDIVKYIPETEKLREIVVTKEQAKQFTNNDPDAQPCVEVLGRNIGIRRATGDIIVSTNIDIIPPRREILDKFIESWYDKNDFYTMCKRMVGVKFTEDLNINIDKMRAYLEKHMYKMPPKGDANCFDPWSRVRGCGDFQMAHRDIWNEIKGFEETFIYRYHSDTQVQAKADYKGHEIKGLYDLPVFHIEHEYNSDADTCKQNPLPKDNLVTNNKETWGMSDKKFEETIR